MLDALDFIAERGGDPEKIRESQRQRGDPVELVDEVIALWQEARSGSSWLLLTSFFGMPRFGMPLFGMRSSARRLQLD